MKPGFRTVGTRERSRVDLCWELDGDDAVSAPGLAGRGYVRDGLYEALRAAFAAAGVPWAGCDCGSAVMAAPGEGGQRG